MVAAEVEAGGKALSCVREFRSSTLGASHQEGRLLLPLAQQTMSNLTRQPFLRLPLPDLKATCCYERTAATNMLWLTGETQNNCM